MMTGRSRLSDGRGRGELWQQHSAVHRPATRAAKKSAVIFSVGWQSLLLERNGQEAESEGE